MAERMSFTFQLLASQYFHSGKNVFVELSTSLQLTQICWLEPNIGSFSGQLSLFADYRHIPIT